MFNRARANSSHQSGKSAPARRVPPAVNLRPASGVHSFAFDFSRLPPPASRVIQTKLEVNQPGDEYEQEADRLSEQVLRMPNPASPCACGGTCSKCQAGQTDSEHASLKTTRVPGCR